MDGFDFTKNLGTALRGGPATWDYARGIAGFWNGPLTDGDGFADAELDAAERRTGVTLPAAFREGYRVLGRRKDLTSNQDTLLSPGDLHLRDGALVFRVENQGACCWGISADRLGQDDPPVGIRSDLADKAAERWEPWLGSVSATFTEIVLTEPLHAGSDVTDFCWSPADGVEEILEREFRALEFPGAPGRRWYAGKDALVLSFEGSGLIARVRSSELLDALRDRLGGEWLEE